MAKAVVITGVKQIDRRLKNLEPKIQRKVIRQSMRKGMKPVLALAREIAPELTGLMKSNIKLRAGKRKRGRISIEVRVDSAEGLTKTTSSGEKVFYPAVVEWGDKDTPPHPFMRPAYDQGGPTAKNTAMHEILEGTLREASK